MITFWDYVNIQELVTICENKVQELDDKLEAIKEEAKVTTDQWKQETLLWAKAPAVISTRSKWTNYRNSLYRVNTILKKENPSLVQDYEKYVKEIEGQND